DGNRTHRGGVLLRRRCAAIEREAFACRVSPELPPLCRGWKLVVMRSNVFDDESDEDRDVPHQGAGRADERSFWMLGRRPVLDEAVACVDARMEARADVRSVRLQEHVFGNRECRERFRRAWRRLWCAWSRAVR